MSNQGKITEKIGKSLVNSNRQKGQYEIYYDHGDSSKPNVAAIKGYYSSDGTVKNENRLTDIDIMIADKNKNIQYLIEIEERESSPKKILGDLFAALMCNHIAVKVDGEQKEFNIDKNTRLIICGILPDKGTRIEKVNNIIRSQVRQFNLAPSLFEAKNIELIFENSLDFALKTLYRQIASELNL